MARTFNGTTQGLSHSATIPAMPFTLFARWRATASATQAMLSVSAGAGSQYHTLRVNGAQSAFLESFDGSVNPTVTTGVGLSLNAWHTAVGVVASATDRRIYQDGGSKVTGATSCTPTGLDTISVGYIARTSPVYFFTGDLAETAIWNIALSDADVLALSLGLSPLFIHPEALVFYAPLLGAYSPEIDIVGHNDLTLINAPIAGIHPNAFYPASPSRGFGIGSTAAVLLGASAFSIGTSPTLSSLPAPLAGTAAFAVSTSNATLKTGVLLQATPQFFISVSGDIANPGPALRSTPGISFTTVANFTGVPARFVGASPILVRPTGANMRRVIAGRGR